MDPLLFTGQAQNKPLQPQDVPSLPRERQSDPAGYLADKGLVDAVNVSLLLGQPLLLTGEPGTGKTQLAYRIAWELGFEPPLVFETKSTSVARDLFYTFDTLGRFQASHMGGVCPDNRSYLCYNALGLAILLANEAAQVQTLLPPSLVHPGRRRSVVLIDEVDKAPRDFPNDVLNEIEHMYFRIPELSNAKIAADPSLRPVVVITSNSEKNLPDPFLRRCVYYHIPFPETARLAQIVQSRLAVFQAPGEPLLASALEFFQGLRRLGLRKPPSTAELINWLNILARRGMKPSQSLREANGQLECSLSALIKTREDMEEVQRFGVEFLKMPQPAVPPPVPA